MKKILITGITGFAGSFLAEHLIKQSHSTPEIFGTYLTDKSLENIASIQNNIHIEKIDLTHFDEVIRLMQNIQPQEVYHLAALPATAASLHHPASFLSNNIDAQLYVLEAVKHLQYTPRILIVGSGMIYGRVSDSDVPISEETPLQPRTPYDVSKITQDYMGLQYFNAYNMHIVRARPFNHAGPRLSDQFVVSAFAKKIAEIEMGEREPVLTVGNLESKRDITDVQDMVSAYALLLEKGIPGEVYNLGRGRSYKIGDLLETLLSLSRTKITVQEDPSLIRNNDITDMICDNSKFSKLTGWRPEVRIEQTLKDTLAYWRERLITKVSIT